MRVVFTETAILGLEKALDFLAPQISMEKLEEIGQQILRKAETMSDQPFRGQIEPHLAHLPGNYRRIIEGHYKIIYRIESDTVFVTDIFDSRQHPDQMDRFDY